MWIVMDDGRIFEGDERMFRDCFFDDVSVKKVLDFARHLDSKCVIQWHQNGAVIAKYLPCDKNTESKVSE